MESDNSKFSRREALIKLLRVAGAGAGAAGLGVWLSEHSWRPETALAMAAKHGHLVPADAKLPEMAIIQGGDPTQLAQQAVEELGGMRRFVSRGDVVLVKPNIGWDRTPEQAANTNPDVVAEIVRQCANAGAKRVIVTDVSCNDARRCGSVDRNAGKRSVGGPFVPHRHNSRQTPRSCGNADDNPLPELA